MKGLWWIECSFENEETLMSSFKLLDFGLDFLLFDFVYFEFESIDFINMCCFQDFESDLFSFLINLIFISS